MWSFWSTGGGTGCTTVAVAAALLCSRQRPTLLVDLRGDAMTMLGAEHPRIGIADWLVAPRPPPDALSRIEVSVRSGLDVLSIGNRSLVSDHVWPGDRGELLAGVLAVDDRQVVVDVGTDVGWCEPIVSVGRRSILVTRLCYLAAARACSSRQPDGIVVLREPGRLLRGSDIGAAFGAPVETAIRWDPAVAAAVDVGTFVAAVPRPLRSLGAVIARW